MDHRVERPVLDGPIPGTSLPSPMGGLSTLMVLAARRSDEPRASCEVQMFGITRDELTPCGM